MIPLPGMSSQPISSSPLIPYAAGDILYASSTSAIAKLAAASAGNVLLSGTSPSWGKVTSSHVNSTIGLTASPLSQFASTTSAQLAGVISDKTGSGALVFGTSPTLVTPILGTPTSGNLANCTFPTLNQNTTGSAATLTTTRTIGGSNFNGSQNVTSFPSPGAIGGTTPSTIAATSLACPTFTTASGAMGFTPAAGSNFNITLSTTGDFAVNTSQLYVDTSAGSVGFGTTTPTATTHTYTLRTNTTKSAALTFGSFSDIDLTNDDSTTYQTVAVVGTVRYRGTSSESGSAKGQRAFDANVFIYNTGTTTDAGGFRLDARNLSTGTVTNLYGTWLPVAVNSGGGTVTNLYGHKVDAQTVGVNNFGYWSNIAAGTGRWNFYAAGTANNYFAGNVGIGATPTAALHLPASTTARASLCMPAGDGPTSKVAGDIWNDNTRKSITAYIGSMTQYDRRVVFSNTAQVDIGSTTTETSLFTTGIGTTTLAANSLAAGKLVEIVIRGFLSTTTTGTNTLQIRCKLAGTTRLDTGAITMPNSIGQSPVYEGTFEIRCYFHVLSSGASGSCRAWGTFVFHKSTGTAYSYAMNQAYNPIVTVDTTATNAIAATAQWGASSAFNVVYSNSQQISFAA